MRKYPAVFSLLFVVIGISLADLLQISSWQLLAAGALSLGAGVAFLKKNRIVATSFLFAAALGLLTGGHFSIRYVDRSHDYLADNIDVRQAYQIYGRVADWPKLKPNRTEIVIAIDSLVSDRAYRVDSRLLLKVTDITTQLQRNDRIEFRGRIYPLSSTRKSDGFDYNRFLHLKGIGGVVYLSTLLNVRVDRCSSFSFLEIIDRLRRTILDSFHRNLAETGAALASGFLLGETREIPPEIYRRFRDSGTLHLLAVSGSNVALVLLAVLFALRPFRVRPKQRVILLIGATILFMLLSYGEPSVVRASIMATLVLMARMLGRKVDLNNIIAVAALIILVAAPSQIYDVGFQLSFVTAWGLIFAVPRLLSPIKNYRTSLWYRLLAFPLVVSLVAQIFSAPLIAMYFGHVPIVSVIANLVIVPLVSAAVIGSLALLLVNLVWPFLALWFGAILNKLMELIILLLNFFGAEHMPVLNSSSLLDQSQLAPAVLAVYCVLLLALMAVAAQFYRRLLVFTILILTNIVLLVSAISGDAEKRTLRIATIPGGTALLLSSLSNEGEADLVITGVRGRDYPIDERILEPFIELAGITKLRAIIIQSSDYNSLDDLLRLAERFDVRRFLISDKLAPSLRDVLTRMDITFPVVPAEMFGGRLEPVDLDGWFADSRAVRWRDNQFSLTIPARPDKSPLPPADRNVSNLLVIGRPWRPTPQEWIEAHASGWDLIVCARIDQYHDSEEADLSMSADWLPPDYLIDLHKIGQLTLHPPFDGLP